jgi:hypothetical protein
VSSELPAAADPAPADGELEDLCSPSRFAAGFGLLVVVSFYSVILGSGSFVLRDFSVFGYPLAHYHRTAFWNGEIPLWNPLSYGGLPFLAQWNTMTLYPGSLLYLLPPLPWSLNFFCVTHLYLAGLGMYFLVRNLSGSNAAGTIAGIAYGFGGLVQNSLMWPNNIAAFGCLPWVLLAVRCGITAGGRPLLLAILAGTMQMLTGAPEIILFTWLLAGLLWITSDFPDRRTIRQSGRRFALIVVAVAAMSAIQLLPFLDLLLHSQRAGGIGNDLWSLDFDGWVNLLAPLYETRTKGIGAYYHDTQAWTHSFYAGGAVIWLAMIAICVRRSTQTIALAAALLVSLVLALGAKGFLFSLIAQLPPLSMVRFPVKFTIIVAVTLPILAGLGLRELLRGGNSKPAAILIAALGGITLVLCRGSEPDNLPAAEVLRNLMWRAAAAAGVIGLIVHGLRPDNRSVRIKLLAAAAVLVWIDLRWHQPNLHPTLDRGWYTQPNPSLAKLGEAALLGERRMHPVKTRQIQNKFNYDASLQEAFILTRVSMFSNWNLAEGTAKINGFYSLWFPEQERIARALHVDPPEVPEGLADFLGIGFISPTENTIEWLPRASAAPLVTIGQAPEFVTPDETLQGMTAPGFDASERVYLPAALAGNVTADSAPLASATNIYLGTDEVVFDASTPVATMAVIAYSFHHPWKAFVDGEPVALHRANLGYQALEVPAGEHHIELRYEDRAFAIGRWITLLTLIGLAWSWRRGEIPEADKVNWPR